MHQYRVGIIKNPGPDLLIAYWLSRQNHKENKDAEIPGMQLILTPYKQVLIYQIASQYTSYNRQYHKISTCSTSRNYHLRLAREQRSNTTRHENIWTFWDDMAVIDGVILKGRHIVILETLQRQALEQLHVIHMGVDKAKLLVWKSIYRIGMNMDIKNT